MAIAEITVDELDDRLAECALIDASRTNSKKPRRRRRAGAAADRPDNVDAFRCGPVYVICKTGPRSLRACEFLAQVEAVNVAGGTLAWIRSGRDVSGNE